MNLHLDYFLVGVLIGASLWCMYEILKKTRQQKGKSIFSGDFVSGNICGGNMHISASNGTTVINGVAYQGTNVKIVNGKVYIDGKEQTDQGVLQGVVEVRILEGALVNLFTDASVTCGEVKGYIDAGGSVTVEGNVGGDIDAGGSVKCGNVAKSVDAGGSVNCGSVGGSIDAGGSVVRRN